MQAVHILLTLSFLSSVSVNMCVLCPAGKYKLGGSSMVTCVDYPEHTFAATLGAWACEACPTYTFSATGSASCAPDACVDDVVVTGCLCTVGNTGTNGGRVRLV